MISIITLLFLFIVATIIILIVKAKTPLNTFKGVLTIRRKETRCLTGALQFCVVVALEPAAVLVAPVAPEPAVV